MSSPTRSCEYRRCATRLVLVAFAVTVVLASLFTSIAAAAAPPPWRVLAAPWPGDAPVYDVSAATPSFVAVAGAGGSVAVSNTGGLTWTLRSPASQGVTADLLGIAFSDTERGVVVGAAGTLLVTDDGGATWRLTGFSGTRPAADLRDVVLVGLQGVAVGDGGVVLESGDGGETWRVTSRPTKADLTCVALAGDGTTILGGVDGSIVMRRDGVERSVTAPLPITAVAASPSPSWGDGAPDVVASTGREVYGSDDGASLTSLLSSVDAVLPPWPAVTMSGAPPGELLLAGPAGAVTYYATATSAWVAAGMSGLGGARAVTALKGQSVAYVLDTSGRIARTISSGRTAATLSTSARTVTAGRTVTLASSVRIAAPGSLVLERRVVGGTWKSAGQIAWTTAGWQQQAKLTSKPTRTSDFRLRFSYGGRSAVVSTTRRVIVRPRLTPDKLRISVLRGQAYRFKGRIYPALRGEKVRLYTDRGGSWHQIPIGGVVKLRDGTRWVSRLFGTPARERYRLRATIGATSRHGSAKSAIVTVTVR